MLPRPIHACADFCNTDLNFAEPFFSSLITHTQYPSETPPLFHIIAGINRWFLMFSVTWNYSWNCRTTPVSGHDDVGTKLYHTPWRLGDAGTLTKANLAYTVSILATWCALHNISDARMHAVQCRAQVYESIAGKRFNMTIMHDKHFPPAWNWFCYAALVCLACRHNKCILICSLPF